MFVESYYKIIKFSPKYMVKSKFNDLKWNNL